MKRSRTAFVLGLAMVVLSACSEDPVPKVAPHGSPAPSVSESANESHQTVSSQRQFLKNFFAVVGDSTTTGNTGTFLDLSSSKCQNCRTLARNIRAAYVDGGHVEGGDWAVSQLVKAPEESPLGTVWNVDVTTSRERWYDGQGDLVKIVRPSTQHFGVVIKDGPDGLVLQDLRLRA